MYRRRTRDQQRSGPRSSSPALALVVIVLLFVAACTGSDSDDLSAGGADDVDSGRSSGDLAFGDTDPTTPSTTPDGPPTSPPGAQVPDPDPGAGIDTGQGSDEGPAVPVTVDRPDGIELIFADGALGPARLGSSIDEIAAALGPAYEITREEVIRAGFSSGYSVASGGEVLFWAVEEDGVIAVFMSSNPRVGLESGLRPKLALADAIALHGEPDLSLGPEGREFASFEDGIGTEGQISVLLAIGDFGGPVGSYDFSVDPPVASGYQLEEANIKELWFWNR